MDLISVMTASGLTPEEIYRKLSVKGYDLIKSDRRNYQYVFLKRDISAPSNPLMGHSACAPEAVVAGHRYDAEVNGVDEINKSLSDILGELIGRAGSSNG